MWKLSAIMLGRAVLAISSKLEPLWPKTGNHIANGCGDANTKSWTK